MPKHNVRVRTFPKLNAHICGVSSRARTRMGWSSLRFLSFSPCLITQYREHNLQHAVRVVWHQLITGNMLATCCRPLTSIPPRLRVTGITFARRLVVLLFLSHRPLEGDRYGRACGPEHQAPDHLHIVAHLERVLVCAICNAACHPHAVRGAQRCAQHVRRALSLSQCATRAWSYRS